MQSNPSDAPAVLDQATLPDMQAHTHVAPHLSLWDVAALTIGIIIGSGIYRSPPDIAKNVGSSSALLLAWIVGGIIAMLGALCYAELAAAYPQAGGTYVYLNKAYGRAFGFLYAWCEFWVVRPGNISAMAFIFVEYGAQIVPSLEHPQAKLGVACGAVLILGLLNLLGVRTGKRTQLVLTAAKILGLVAIFVVSLLPSQLPLAEITSPAEMPSSQVNWSLAMVFVLFAYGGWNETAAVAAEVRDPQRNMLRGLLLGTALVVLVYLLVNIALLRGLGFAGVANGEAVVAALMQRQVGPLGSKAISILVCISCLGAINGMLFTGSRLYYALGVELPAFRWLGHWNLRLGTPVRALALQTGVSIALLLVFAQARNAFEQLVYFTVPLFWTFLLLVAAAVVILRWREPQVPRPFRLPLYPLEPLVFFASSGFMVYSGIQWLRYQSQQPQQQWDFWFSAGSMVAVVVVGLVIWTITWPRAPRETS